MLDLTFPVAGLRGAQYNPRAITDDAIEKLKTSIMTLGFCKPVIVTRDGLLVAGHQRTKAARSLGRETVPAWVLPDIGPADEIRFNQLHNGTDLDACDAVIRVAPGAADGAFAHVPVPTNSAWLRTAGAGIRKDLCRLLSRYGNWGGAVATESGEVISSPQYVLACSLLGMPARVYYVANRQADAARTAFGQQYGEFSYDHLERATYVQGYAQMFRLREGIGSPKSAKKSALYECNVIPDLKPGERVLDFGCGQGDYVKALKARGVDIHGVEFFRRKGSAIDRAAVMLMVDGLIHRLRRNGLFDVVVLDSVLNSVDSLQAEDDVLTCLSAFCRPGGRVYFSGRHIDSVDDEALKTKATSTRRAVEFLDKDGFSAIYRNGNWFYQKHHSTEDVVAFAARFTRAPVTVHRKNDKVWQVAVTNAIAPDFPIARAAIAREFNLPWPNGQRVNRHADVLAVWEPAFRRAYLTMEN